MTPSTRARVARRRYLVDPSYQWRVTRLLVIIMLVVVLVTLTLICGALWSTIGDLRLGPSALFIAVFRAVAWLVVVELIVLVPLIILLGIRLTHRVVGPMARIKAALEQLGEGRYDLHLTLRDGDVLADLAKSITRLAARLRDRHR